MTIPTSHVLHAFANSQSALVIASRTLSGKKRSTTYMHDAAQEVWLSQLKVVAVPLVVSDVSKGVLALIDRALGYLLLDLATPTLSPGELKSVR